MGRPIYIPAGTLQEYLSKHPEHSTPMETIPSISSTTSTTSSSVNPSRSNSFSNLFKLSQKSPKKPPPIKKHIPLELLDKYHILYVEELKRVYEENKDRFGYSDVKLNIVE